MLNLIQVDGKIDLAKTAAFMAHVLMASAFLRLQAWPGSEFNETIWFVYGGFAIAHDAYNRVTAMVQDNRIRKMAVEAQPSVVTTMTSVETQ